MPKWHYHELLGTIMYVATCTKPDIMHAVEEVTKYWKRYGNSTRSRPRACSNNLNTIEDFSIVHHVKEKAELLGYAGASWESNLDSHRSEIGHVFYLHGNVVSWKSKRQPTVASSSTEAEYMDLYAAVQDALWLRLLVSNIGFELGA